MTDHRDGTLNSANPRRGLVIGAGGVLGFSWVVGALTALQEAEGFDAREVAMLVGTSAGSITAALLGCGVPVEALLRREQGIPAPGDPVISYDHDTDGSGPLPPRPGVGVGSTGLLLRTARSPRRVPPLAALAAVLPVAGRTWNRCGGWSTGCSRPPAARATGQRIRARGWWRWTTRPAAGCRSGAPTRR